MRPDGLSVSCRGGQHRSTDRPDEIWAIVERGATPKRSGDVRPMVEAAEPPLWLN
jgi:hypothetical protein